LKLALPAWLALSTQVPTLTNVTVPDESVQPVLDPATLIVTASPELADAVGTYVPPYRDGDGGEEVNDTV
jgi:hypothetical protein